MTSRTNEYVPNYLVLPGDHIGEFLEAYGMSQKELAERAGVTPQYVNAVIKGGARITPEFARSLGMIFDYPAEMWLSFQSAYDISFLERKEEEELIYTA
ncbi:MAG: HigA family addiction module antitoxin [Synergistaceae bacterium]|nr:HigA family addiction module antitoxin [Synergistaceae bacterium]